MEEARVSGRVRSSCPDACSDHKGRWRQRIRFERVSKSKSADRNARREAGPRDLQVSGSRFATHIRLGLKVLLDPPQIAFRRVEGIAILGLVFPRIPAPVFDLTQGLEALGHVDHPFT